MQGGGAARQKCLPGPRQEGGGGSYPRGGATLAREEHTPGLARTAPEAAPRSRLTQPQQHRPAPGALQTKGLR